VADQKSNDSKPEVKAQDVVKELKLSVPKRIITMLKFSVFADRERKKTLKFEQVKF
jgi:hypothetical protein